MSAVSRILPVILVVLVAPVVHAAFPYNADWLNYADKRIVYQLDVSNVSSNEPDIYVTININTQTLQEFIDKWSNVCDEIGRYDWFYPTFTYASTRNENQRMLEVVTYDSWQTFTVGSCGSVELPTRFVVKLPNGVLDGEDYFQSHTHYVYAYLKYPYADDFYDNPVGTPASEYALVSGGMIVEFNSEYLAGHRLNINNGDSDKGAGTRIRWQRQITADTSRPLPMCFKYYDAVTWLTLRMDIMLDNGEKVEYILAESEVHTCIDISGILKSRGHTGTVTVEYIDLYYLDDTFPTYKVIFDYLWIIPQEVYREALYS